MSSDIFLRIMHHYRVTQLPLCAEKKCSQYTCIKLFFKVIATFYILTYEVPIDATDEYIHIRESTGIESLQGFVIALIDIFEDEYLRSPNEADTIRLVVLGEQNGLPNMLGSINFMH